MLQISTYDLQRKLGTLNSDLLSNELISECKSVLQNFQPSKQEIQDEQGKWYTRHISLYRTEDRRVEGVVIVFQDITAFKSITQRAIAREKQQEIVAMLGMLALKGTPPHELMQQVVKQVAYVLDADFCKILKYQPEDDTFLLLEGVGWHEGLVGNALIPAGHDSQAGYTLISQDPIIVQNLSHEKRFSGPQLLIDHGVSSGISCLIRHAETPYGVLGVHTRDEREFKADDANFLLSIANMLANALHTSQANKKIYDSEVSFRTMANAIPQLAWMTDATGYIYWYNQRWYDFTGTSLEEMEGWGWQKVHHPEHVDRVVKNIKHCFETGEVWEDTFPLRSKEGNYHWFLSRAMPLRDREGNITSWFGTNTDITEKLEREEAQRQSEARIRLAKDSARLGLFDYDITRNKIEWEPLLHRIWGISMEEPVTLETFFAGLHAEDVEHTQQAIQLALDPEEGDHYEVTYRVINKQNAKTYWIKASGTVLFEDKQPVRMIGLINDISEQKELEFSLKKARDETERAARAKDEFLSTMSHEIRTPLNAIIGLSDLLLSKNPRPEQQESLSGLRFSSKSLLNLINDFLDFSKIEAGKVELEYIHYDIRDLINNLYRTYLQLCEEKQNTLSCTVDDKVPEVLVGDPYRLTQVLTNLLSNANKFTDRGNIKLELTVAALTEKDVTLKFMLSDTGVGISEDKLEVIFDKFSQADSSTVRQYGGTGLGLNISRALLQLMSSDIEVQSQPGQGTSFYFSLTQQIGESDKIQEPELGQSREEVRTKGPIRILLVEDMDLNRMVMQQHLESWLGLLADEAVNGKEAVELAEKHQYNLILMDIRMPEMDGVQATRLIRQQNEWNARMPILALTADTRISDLGAEETKLFTQRISKPFDPDYLYKLLISLLPNPDQSSAQEKHAEAASAPTKEVDFSKIEAQFGEKDVIMRFLSKAQKALSEFQDNYFKGMRAADKPVISDAVHKAKVLFDMLGLLDLHQQMSDARELLMDGENREALGSVLQSFEEKLEKVQQELQAYQHKLQDS